MYTKIWIFFSLQTASHFYVSSLYNLLLLKPTETGFLNTSIVVTSYLPIIYLSNRLKLLLPLKPTNNMLVYLRQVFVHQSECHILCDYLNHQNDKSM